ncbi:MAG: M1 family metallopeptidase [Bacteroidota bacterium]
MKVKKLGILLLAIAFGFPWGSLQAQEKRFFMPREIKEAYNNGTRAYDGRPGPNYWQNLVDYQIEVEVIPEQRLLKGSENVTFHNNSPNNIGKLVVRLYHDVFREANPRAYRVQSDDINEGVKISRLVISGEKIDLDNPRSTFRQGTNMTIGLPETVKAGEMIEMEIDWEQYIPETTVRTGAYDSTSFFIAYWYPQIAVYDDVFGWDNLSYDFSTEFYNNLANYDVKITAPKNFTVLSTGQLQNPEAVLAEKELNKYKKALKSSETVSIVGLSELEEGVAHQGETWHYKASEVSDFSFCLSDHFCWDAAMVEIDNREVIVHTYYNTNVEGRAKNITAQQRKMMQHFSEDMPGIPYPYPEFTTFIAGIGGGGMETPMMANNGQPGLGVTVHEMFHTYFPMYVRTNEKRFAWMDEGWADFNTSFVVDNFFNPDDKPVYYGFGTQLGTMGSISDLPLITSTQFMDNSNYGYTAYPLPAFLYSVLYHHLGDELFKKCFREYIRTWAKKSPTPYDFFYTFERVSGQDLGWFWKPWFFDYGNVDVKIASYKKGKLHIVNEGTRPLPISIDIKYADGSSSYKSFSAESWEEGSFTTTLERAKEIESVAVNAYLPDGDILDNFYPPLKDQFSDLIAEGMLGTYKLNEFPASVIISKKEGVLFFSIAEAGFANYLLPKEDGYETLDGVMNVSFEQEGDTYTGLSLKFGGRSATGKKQ